MGIINATGAAVSGAMDDQWKDFYVSRPFGGDNLLVQAERQNHSNHVNLSATNNVITDGSVIVVGVGECAVATENGKVLSFYKEPGEYEFHSPESAGVFSEGGLANTASDIRDRVGFGGLSHHGQKIYYIRLKEMMEPVFTMFTNIQYEFRGVNMDISLHCDANYSFRIADPEKFFEAFARDGGDGLTGVRLRSQMKSEMKTFLQTAFNEVCQSGVPASEISKNVDIFCDIVSAKVSEYWMELRGITIVSLTMPSLRIDRDDLNRLKELETIEMFTNKDYAREALIAAAAGKVNPNLSFFGSEKKKSSGRKCPACGHESSGKFCEECGSPLPEIWICRCGTENTGKFCMECGAPKPETWTCSCGTVNKGKFCMECGSPKPEN